MCEIALSHKQRKNGEPSSASPQRSTHKKEHIFRTDCKILFNFFSRSRFASSSSSSPSSPHGLDGMCKVPRKCTASCGFRFPLQNSNPSLSHRRQTSLPCQERSCGGAATPVCAQRVQPARTRRTHTMRLNGHTVTTTMTTTTTVGTWQAAGCV